MLKSPLQPLSLLLYFLLSLFLTLGQGTLLPHAATAQAPPIHLAQTPSLQQRGRQLYQAGQLTDAIITWEQAVQTLEEQGDYLNQASVLSNLALAYQQQGHWEQAQAAIDKSLDLLNATTSEGSAATASIFAQIWNTQGNLALLRSQPTQALNAFEHASHYYNQADDPNGLLRSQINQAQALQSLGFYRRAITLLTTSATPLMEQPDSPIKVTGLQLLGDLWRLTGDLETAQSTLETGLVAAQSFDDPETMATLHLSLGHTAQAKKESDGALDHYQRAAAIATSPALKLRIQLSQWTLFRETNNMATADTLYQSIQADIATLPVSRMTVNTHLELASQQLEQATLSPHIPHDLEIAKQQAIELEDLRAESYALGYLGEFYLQQQQWSAAQAQLKQALSLAETIKAADLAYQWHWRLGQLQRQQGTINRSITSYENAVRNLQALRSNLIAIAPDLRFDFRERVEPVYREWVDVLLTEAKHSNSDQQTQLVKARQAIESLQLAELENFFQEPCVPISQEIDQVIENADAPTAVFYPIILPDRLEILLKLPQQPLQQYTTQISQSDLETLLTQLQSDIQLPWTINQVQAESAQLYDWLIHPVETILETNQIDTIVFVLDGFLRSIPMSVLYDGQQYLVEKYNIALAPGLQMVDPQPLKRQKLATIIAGLSESRNNFSALPFVAQEIDQIQKSTPSRVLFNESFTASNLEAIINNTDFPLVHLATHGQFSSNPDETFVLAWDQPIKMNELNRLLRQGEQNRQSAIELLILSACQTATGDKRAALGLAGVAVQAGARSTLASLWNLDDKSGALFADLFYQELQTPNISKAQALRQAQLRLLRGDPEFQHPRSWAAYVLLGNWL